MESERDESDVFFLGFPLLHDDVESIQRAMGLYDGLVRIGGLRNEGGIHLSGLVVINDMHRGLWRCANSCGFLLDGRPRFTRSTTSVEWGLPLCPVAQCVTIGAPGPFPCHRPQLI